MLYVFLTTDSVSPAYPSNTLGSKLCPVPWQNAGLHNFQSLLTAIQFDIFEIKT